MAATANRFGTLRLSHMAAIKRALVHTVTSYAPTPKVKKETNRAWEALFYAVAAVAAPHLVMADNLEEFAASTASPLPTPGGGPHAAAIAAHGAALLEMSLNITALSHGGSAAPDEVLAKLREARAWLIDCVRDDVNAYCGLLSSVYGRINPEEQEAAVPSPEEAERRRWLRRAAEVPLRVAELAMGTAIACLGCKRLIRPSLKGDWIAGAKLLCTAYEISNKNVQINLRDLGTNKGANDLEKRFAQLRDTEPPWEDLVDLPI
ncbi:unnamed protein product [Polarella glacialis]|uniref:Cyclodeaminase/cyclohydrolase domain-containing protein n=2 Tax=Polarella glacialis TaxID=89957 RepID=A0A813GQZ4_POLGL|nr:unnamed protein product [Polarella glacialis]